MTGTTREATTAATTADTTQAPTAPVEDDERSRVGATQRATRPHRHLFGH